MTQFEIHDQESDAIPASLADPVEDALPDELLSPEEIEARNTAASAAIEDEKRRKDEATAATIEKFAGILKVIEDSPSPQPRTPIQETVAQPQQPTAEQVKEWDDKLRELQVTNPTQYAALMREGAVQEAERRILSQAGGVLESAGEGFIERFKSDKKGESPFYAQIEKIFATEMSDIPPQQLLQMSPDQRKTEMTRRWNAAAGIFFEKNAKPTQTLATTASRGTSMSPSSGNRGTRQKVTELSDGEKVALMRGFTGGKKVGTPEYDAAKKRALSELAKIEYGIA